MLDFVPRARYTDSRTNCANTARAARAEKFPKKPHNMRTFSAQTRLQLQAGGIKAAAPLKMVMLPSIDKDTHGFDGQKNVHTSSKTLEIHKVFPAAFSSSGRLSASAKLLAPDSDGFSCDFWLLRRRCVVTHQDEKGKKRRKDTLSGVCALVNRGYKV